MTLIRIEPEQLSVRLGGDDDFRRLEVAVGIGLILIPASREEEERGQRRQDAIKAGRHQRSSKPMVVR